MRFGIHLGNSGPTATKQSLAALARAADEARYDSVWVSDHVVIPERFESVYPFRGRAFTPDSVGRYYEPLMTLGFIAGATAHVRLGTSVLIVPQRNPLVLAKQIATLDELSGGRVDLGVGAGWLAEEFADLGASFEDRGSVLEEWLRIFKTVWSQESAGFQGRHYSFGPVRFEPRPAQIGGPPVTIGGHSDHALRRAATMVDGWQAIHLSAEEVAGPIARVRSLAEQGGRDPASLHMILRCGVRFGDGEGSAPEPWLLRGTPDEVAEGIERYAEAGVTELVFTVAAGAPLYVITDTIRRVADEVIPRFRPAV